MFLYSFPPISWQLLIGSNYQDRDDLCFLYSLPLFSWHQPRSSCSSCLFDVWIIYRAIHSDMKLGAQKMYPSISMLLSNDIMFIWFCFSRLWCSMKRLDLERFLSWMKPATDGQRKEKKERGNIESIVNTTG